MNKLSNDKQKEIIDYLSYLIETGIYTSGVNSKLIAIFLYSQGVRVHIGTKAKKCLKVNIKD